MISFYVDTELEIVTDFDETVEVASTTNEQFGSGEIVDADIIDEREEKGEEFVDLQFADGSVAFNVRRSTFEILP